MHGGNESTACPECGRRVPVLPGYPTWCDSCGWNLVSAEARASADENAGRLGFAVGQPRVLLSREECEAIDEELRPVRQKLERRLIREYRSSLYAG